jgi:leader peptidase (prepilin peptidase)/N-methyltransferase
MIVYYWLLVVFVLGAVVGSFLNVAVSRLPLEKSLLWPGSRCGNCYQPIRWYDNLPLVSYLWLHGRCRTCAAPFSLRYFMIELLTGLGFTGLFVAEVVMNVHDWPTFDRSWAIERGLYPWQWWAGFVFHAILFSFLMAASACDLDGREIPLELTLTGSAVGLVGAVLFPWPWPWWPPTVAAPAGTGFGDGWVGGTIKEGIYAWPVWGPLPDWLAPGGNWQTGLATGLAGLLAGTLLIRGVGFVCSAGLGREALGLGDADLMMMAGCFLGWQPVVVALFVSAVPALLVGILQLLVNKDDSLPFGPSLAAGLLLTMLSWSWLGPNLQIIFFWGGLLLALLMVLAASFFGLSFLMRMLRR